MSSSPLPWAFRNRLCVDTMAAAWLVVRYGGAEVCFICKRDEATVNDSFELLCFESDRWRAVNTEGHFAAVMDYLKLDDPALIKLARVVKESDHRVDNPSPLAMSLTSLIQGWRLIVEGEHVMPVEPTDENISNGEYVLTRSLPVFDSLFVHFKNLLSGPKC